MMERAWFSTAFWSGLVDRFTDAPAPSSVAGRPLAIVRKVPFASKPKLVEGSILQDVEAELADIRATVDAVALPDGPWARREGR